MGGVNVRERETFILTGNVILYKAHKCKYTSVIFMSAYKIMSLQFIWIVFIKYERE